jgi:hypothetical protein
VTGKNLPGEICVDADASGDCALHVPGGIGNDANGIAVDGVDRLANEALE